MWFRLLKILQYSVTTFCLLVLCYVVYGLGKNFTRSFKNEELPLHDIQGIIVNDSIIYIGLGEYNQVQEYSIDGVFLKHYPVTASKWGFTFHLGEDKKVSSCSKSHVSGLELLSYAKDSLSPEAYNVLAKAINVNQIVSPNEFRANSDKIYRVEGSYFLKVYEYTGDHRKLLIDQSLYTKSLKGLITSWLIGVVTIIVLGLTNIVAISEHVSKNIK